MTTFLRVMAAGLLAAMMGFATLARAAPLPVVKLVNGTPISPTAAETYYSAFSNPTTHTAGLCGLNAILCGVPRAIPIHELARTLSQNGALTPAQFTQNVFEYVYRNIDTEFRYGLSKGAFGALLDQSGTPFDQANLMVELLKEGGVISSNYGSLSPSYQAGTISLTPAQFQAWTGLTNAQAACQYLANGAIPAIVNGSSGACSTLSGNVTSLNIAHIWVLANGQLYDPSFKTYIQKTGVTDLAAVIGCGVKTAPTCGSSALAVAIPSTSQGFDSAANANYVQNVQYAALGSTLNGFATNLQHYIQNSAPAADVQDIVGGQKIDPASAPASGGLAYTIVQTQHAWTDIPDQYRSRLNIQISTLNVTVFADETVGYWLYMGGYDDPGNVGQFATLFFEREVNSTFPITPGLYNYTATGMIGTNQIVPLATINASNGYFPSANLTLNIFHPYASNGGTYMNDTFQKVVYTADMGSLTSSVNGLSPFLIVQAWGRTGPGSATRAAKMAAGVYPGSLYRSIESSTLAPGKYIGEPILTTTSLPGILSGWLSQAGIATSMNDGIAQTRTQEHHTFGVSVDQMQGNQPANHGVDAWSSMSLMSTTMTPSAVQTAFNADSLIYNALEGSIIEQQEDSGDGGSAVRWFELTNEKSNRFYQVSSSNYPSVKSQLTNYKNWFIYDPITFIESYINSSAPTFNMILTRNGGVGSWKTSNVTITYVYTAAFAYSTDGTQLGYVTTEGMKGSDSETGLSDPAGQALTSIKTSQPQKPLDYSISPANGALSIAMAPDLVTGSGSFPYSLKYQRFYDTSDVSTPACPGEQYNISFATFIFQTCAYEYGQRLANGWRDTYQIEGRFSNDGLRGLGSDSALDASAAITALYTINNLAASQTFTSYLSNIFVAAWLTDQIGGNAVTLKLPPATESFLRLPDGSFNPRPGSQARLQRTGPRNEVYSVGNFAFDYSNIGINYIDSKGATLTFTSNLTQDHSNANRNFFQPKSWSFPDGVQITFSYDGNFAMTGVSNNLGRSLTFATDAAAASDPDGYTTNGWTVTDDTGRTVHTRDRTSNVNSWAYPTFQPLQTSTKIILPDGSQSRVNYSVTAGIQAQLSAIYLPNSLTTPYLSFSYDNLYRAQSATYANGKTATYYPGQVSAEPSARGQVVDALGNVTTTYFDRMSHPVVIIDPLGHKSVKAYDDIGRLVLDVSPLLGCAAKTYDVRSNVVSTSQYPAGGCSLADPANGQWAALAASPPTPIVTSTTYNEGSGVYTCTYAATCNKPAAQTDALGYVTNYSWNTTTGQLAQILKPADASGVRPETDLAYGLYSPYSPFSLLTQKTEKMNAAQSVVTTYNYNASNKYVLQTATVDPGSSPHLNLTTCFKFDAVGNLISTTDARAGSCP